MKYVIAFCIAVATAFTAKADDSSARTQMARGTAALNAGRNSEARDAFAAAVAAAPDWGLARLNLGIAEQALDPESDQARSELETALQLEPNNPLTHYHLGLSYDRKGRFSDAAKQFATAAQLRPQMLDAHFQLANALRMSGDDNGAIAAYETLLEHDPYQIGGLLSVAELYEKSGRYDDAERALITTTRLQPAVAYHQYRLAKFYERVGNTHKAQMAFARADRLHPKPQRKMRPLLKSR